MAVSEIIAYLLYYTLYIPCAFSIKYVSNECVNEVPAKNFKYANLPLKYVALLQILSLYLQAFTVLNGKC